MGIYLLTNCDTQRATDIWQAWYQQPRNKQGITCEVQTESLDAQDHQRILISVHINYLRDLQIFYIFCVVFFLVSFEGALLALPWLGNFLWQIASNTLVYFNALVSFLTFLSGCLLAMFLCLTGLSPFLMLNLAGESLRKREYSLQNFYKEAGIDMLPLSPPRSWLLFPRDALLIESGLLCIQLFIWLGLSPFLRLFLPYLVIGIVLLILVLLREYAYQRIVANQQQHAYWKLEVTRLAGRVTYFFLLPLLFYIMIFVLQNVSFLLLLRGKTFPEVSSNLIITSRGYPDLPEWEKSTHLIANPLFQQIISVSSIILTAVLLVLFIAAWVSSNTNWQSVGQLAWDQLRKSPHLQGQVKIATQIASEYKPLSTDIWHILEIFPLKEVPRNIRQPHTSLLINAVITFDWLFIFVFHSLGILSVIVAMVWPYITDGKLILIAASWIVPFLWYQEVLKILWGDIAGNIASYIIVFVVCAPAWFWLSLWLCSLGEAIWRLLVLTFSPTAKNKEITTMVADLCKQLHIASPILRIDSDASRGILTTPLLPLARFCVISLPRAVVENLTSDELRIVLVHELAHVAKHARKIWLAQQLSRMAIFGSGYLTLQLNYWAMEIEADMVAVAFTGDVDALRTAIRKVQEIQADQNIATQIKASTEQHLQARGLIKNILGLYDWYFSDNLWGAFHPEEERLSYLQGLSSTTEDILDVSGQVVSPPRKHSTRKKWIAAVVILGCVILLFRNVLFPSAPTPKSASSTTSICPAPSTVRPSVMLSLPQGNNQNIVYTENEGTEQAPKLGKLKRYDLATHLATEIIKLPNTWISNVQISANRQWLLFNAQVAGQSELQLVRVDGQKLQTVYCLNTKAPLSFSWSLDPQWVVLADPRFYSRAINIINISEGNIRTQDLSDRGAFIAWRDGTKLFMDNSSYDMHHSMQKIDILDISHQQVTLTNIPGVKLQGDWTVFGFHISQDHKTLFTNRYLFGQGIGKGPGSITMQSLTGEDSQTIYATPDYAITQLQVTPTALIFVIENSDLNPDNPLALDFSQNGLWKININGTGLTRLKTTSKGEAITLADVSPDGDMHGLATVTSNSNTSTLAYNSLDGQNTTIFVSAAGNTTLSFVGWVRV